MAITPATFPQQKPQAAASTATDEAPGTYEFRWDIEVPIAERRYGQKFMKQWKRVLQAQKLTPLVSARLCPQRARFQLCVGGDAEQEQIRHHEAEVLEELAHLRRGAVPTGTGIADAGPIEGEPAGTHPAGWQGVRVWMTFARRDVEAALAKKPKI
jgi:hypothetical protein